MICDMHAFPNFDLGDILLREIDPHSDAEDFFYQTSFHHQKYQKI